MRGSTIGGIVGAAAAAAGVVAFVDWQLHPERWTPKARRDRRRRANREVFNPIVLRVARLGGPYVSVVEHVGRRSGRVYQTPVVALPTADGFVVPLSYGRDVDWLRNLEAAGGGVLTYAGDRRTVAEPAVVDAAAALPLIDERQRWLWSRFGYDEFLRLKVATPLPV